MKKIHTLALLSLSLLGCTLGTQVFAASDTGATPHGIFQFGEGVWDTKIQERFERLLAPSVFNTTSLTPTSRVYQKQLGNQQIWTQDFTSQDGTEYSAFYNAAIDRVVPVTQASIALMQEKNLGLPLSYPRLRSTPVEGDPNAITTYLMQAFENGYILESEKTVFGVNFPQQRGVLTEETDPNTTPNNGGTTTDRELKVLTNEEVGAGLAILPGAGIDDVDARISFLTDYTLKYKKYTPTAKAVQVPDFGWQQEMQDAQGNKALAVFNPQDGYVYLIEGAMYQALTADDLKKLGVPLSNGFLQDGDTNIFQTFLNGTVLYSVTTGEKKVNVNEAFADHQILPDEIGPIQTPHEGKVNIILLRVQFPDMDPTLAPSDDFYDQAFNNDGISFHSYWNTVSDGKLQTKTLVRTLKMPRTLASYLAEVPPDDDRLKMSLAKEVLLEIAKARDIDWSSADINGKDGKPDGYIDGIQIMYDVHDAQLQKAGMPPFTMNAFAWLSTNILPQPLTVTDSAGKTYIIGPLSFENAAENGISTFMHEFGHMLGLMDLYDISYQSNGIVQYSLMAYSHNTYNNIEGEFIFQHSNLPQLLDAYSRIALGWAKVVEVHGRQDLTLYPSSDSNVVYKLGEGKEYFLLENRHKTSFDRLLPDEGLAVYHVIENAANNGNMWSPRLSLIPASAIYPLQYGATTTLFTEGSLLPSAEQTHGDDSFVKGHYHQDTNYVDGSRSNIRLENIDTTSNYPQITLQAYYPGRNNEFATLENGQVFQPGQADIDQNKTINEDDHTLLLQEVLKGSRVLEDLRNVYRALQASLSDTVRPFQTALNPLQIVSVATEHITQKQIVLHINTNFPTRLHLSYGEKNQLNKTLDPEELTKTHIVTLDQLQPHTTYYIAFTAETAWKEQVRGEAQDQWSYTTLPTPLLDNLIRSTYLDIEPNDAALAGVQDLDGCLSKYDKLLDRGAGKYVFATQRPRIRFDASISTDYVVQSNVILVRPSWVTEGLCGQKFDLPFMRVLLSTLLQDQQVTNSFIPSGPLNDAILTDQLLDFLPTDKKPETFLFKGNAYTSGKQLKETYFTPLYQDLLAGKVTASDANRGDLLVGYFLTKSNETEDPLRLLEFIISKGVLFQESNQTKLDRFIKLYSIAIGQDASSTFAWLGFTPSANVSAVIQEMLSRNTTIYNVYAGADAANSAMGQAFDTARNAMQAGINEDDFAFISSLVESYNDVFYQRFTVFSYASQTSYVFVYNPVLQQAFVMEENLFVQLMQGGQSDLVKSMLHNEQRGTDKTVHLFFQNVEVVYDETTRKFSNLPYANTIPTESGITTSASEKATFNITGQWNGRHITLLLNPATAKLLDNPKLLVDKLDRVYDFYVELVKGAPYNGATITMQERCGRVNPLPASDCPNGYMTYYDSVTPSDYWATAGQTVEIASSSMKQSIQLFNTSGALPLGFPHELGHDFDDVSAHPQYILHGASREAWANLKAMYAIDAAGLPLELGGTIYDTTQKLIDGFYRPFLQKYQDQQLTFQSLISDAPVVGSLTDYYISVLLPLIDSTSRDQMFQTIQFYKANENKLTIIGDGTYAEKQKRFAQFLLIWSCKSGKDLASMLQLYRFDISDNTKTRIQSCVNAPAASRTDDFILSLDKLL